MAFIDDLTADLEALRASGRYRKLREISVLDRSRGRLEGEVLCNLSGNDYLGIAGDSALRSEFYADRMKDPGDPELMLSAASSRLLTGNTPAYVRLEAELSRLYGGRAALVFNSGYHANIGILPALSGGRDLILSDKLNHASIIDGMRLCEAEFRRFRHLDCDGLERILKARRADFRRCFIVTESVFSMDGDAADLRRLVELKKQYDCVLVVDEAHAVGVRGPQGAGLAAEMGVAAEVDVLIGTFGKAFGSTGAYAITTPEVREYLVNHVRPLIFTTGLPPMVLNWSAFVLRKCAAMEERRAKLRRMWRRLRELMADAGRPAPGDSQIVPYLIGGDREAAAAAERFKTAGFLVFAIRPPTVPEGTSRLRFSLNAALAEADIERLGGLL